MTSEQLDAAAAELRSAQSKVTAALVLCSVYAEARAREGDAVAELLVELLHDAERRAQAARLDAHVLLPSATTKG